MKSKRLKRLMKRKCALNYVRDLKLIFIIDNEVITLKLFQLLIICICTFIDQKQVELLDKETKLMNVQHALKETEETIEKLKQVVVDQKRSLEQAKERDVALNERLQE